MTDIPTGAQRSDDGQWWWDGAQWQPVANRAAGGATATSSEQQGAAAAAPSEAAGQLSEDGQWRWDGSQWQPAQDAAAAAPAAGAAEASATTPSATAASATAASGRRVSLGTPTAEAHAVHDGTMEAVIAYSVTNTGTTPIEATSAQLGFFVVAAGQTAESATYITGDMPVTLAVGEVHNGHGRLQLDPGSWTLWVSVSDTTTGDSLGISDNASLEVAGHQATGTPFDDTQTYTLTLRITSVEHVAEAMYRVHYEVESDRDVPAGLPVAGRVEGSQSSTGQIYDLTAPITAGRSHPHYLTLGADAPSHSTAFITLDPGGPSEKSESVVIDIADDGTPTVAR
jgi:hypothetical protein